MSEVTGAVLQAGTENGHPNQRVIKFTKDNGHYFYKQGGDVAWQTNNAFGIKANCNNANLVVGEFGTPIALGGLKVWPDLDLRSQLDNVALWYLSRSTPEPVVYSRVKIFNGNIERAIGIGLRTNRPPLYEKVISDFGRPESEGITLIDLSLQSRYLTDTRTRGGLTEIQSFSDVFDTTSSFSSSGTQSGQVEVKTLTDKVTYAQTRTLAVGRVGALSYEGSFDPWSHGASNTETYQIQTLYPPLIGAISLARMEWKVGHNTENITYLKAWIRKVFFPVVGVPVYTLVGTYEWSGTANSGLQYGNMAEEIEPAELGTTHFEVYKYTTTEGFVPPDPPNNGIQYEEQETVDEKLTKFELQSEFVVNRSTFYTKFLTELQTIGGWNVPDSIDGTSPISYDYDWAQAFSRALVKTLRPVGPGPQNENIFPLGGLLTNFLKITFDQAVPATPLAPGDEIKFEADWIHSEAEEALFWVCLFGLGAGAIAVSPALIEAGLGEEIVALTISAFFRDTEIPPLVFGTLLGVAPLATKIVFDKLPTYLITAERFAADAGGDLIQVPLPDYVDTELLVRVRLELHKAGRLTDIAWFRAAKVEPELIDTITDKCVQLTTAAHNLWEGPGVAALRSSFELNDALEAFSMAMTKRGESYESIQNWILKYETGETISILP